MSEECCEFCFTPIDDIPCTCDGSEAKRLREKYDALRQRVIVTVGGFDVDLLNALTKRQATIDRQLEKILELKAENERLKAFIADKIHDATREQMMMEIRYGERAEWDGVEKP